VKYLKGLRQSTRGLQAIIAWESPDRLPLRFTRFWPFLPQNHSKTRFLAVLLATALKRLAGHKWLGRLI
jgi:hypothetical protein